MSSKAAGANPWYCCSRREALIFLASCLCALTEVGCSQAVGLHCSSDQKKGGSRLSLSVKPRPAQVAFLHESAAAVPSTKGPTLQMDRCCLTIVLLVLLTCSACATVVRGPESCAEAERSEFNPATRGATFRAAVRRDIGLYQDGSVVTMLTTWTMSDITNASIQPGDPLIVILEDGTRLTLPAASAAAPVLTGYVTKWTLYSVVDKAQLGALARSGVAKAMLSFRGISMLLPEVHGRAKANLQTLAICFNGEF